MSSEAKIKYIDEQIKSLFDSIGDVVPDILSILHEKEKHYLIHKFIDQTSFDENWESIKNRIDFKIDVVDTLTSYLVDNSQLYESSNERNKRNIIPKLYSVLSDLFLMKSEEISGSTFSKLEFLVLSCITGVAAERTTEIAMIVKENSSWISKLANEDDVTEMKKAVYIIIIGLLDKIEKREQIEWFNEFIKRSEVQLSNLQIEELKKESFSIENALVIGTFSNLIHIINSQREYLFTGKMSSGEKVRDIIRDYGFNSIELSKRTDDKNLQRICFHMRRAFTQLSDNAIWTLAERNPIFKDFFDKTLSGNENFFVTLFPSQRKSILDVLTAKKSIVVNMPTSSGKSLLAEMYILFTIHTQTFNNVEPTVAYVVPTNALINQVKHRLRRQFADRYVIESVLPFYEEDSLEEEFLNKKTHIHIIVTTPEKLDFLIRNERPVVKNLKLVILDEAHNLSSKNRGSKFELLLSIIKQKTSNVNFLLLSPFIDEKNAQQIATWLGDTEENSSTISVDWSPTKQYIGCNTLESNKTQSFVTYLPSPTNQIIKEEVTIPLNVNLQTLKATLGLDRVDSKVKVIGLLENYITIGESTLVFCGGITSSQNTAIKAKEYFRGKGVLKNISDDPAIARCVTVIKYESKEDDPLIDCVEHGVAYHHSELSGLVKEEIEILISLGKIKLVCSTPTLAQGMNFPISTVIFDTLSIGRDEVDNTMDNATFWNIAGRAGRAYMDKEGHIIIGYSTNNEITKEATKQYIGKKTKEIISSLSHFFDAIGTDVEFNHALLRNNPAASNFLQYLNHIIKISYNYDLNSVDSNKIRAILNNSLYYKQITFKEGFLETEQRISSFASKYVEHLKGQNKANLTLADVFGISNISLNGVMARIIEFKNNLQAEGVLNNENLHVSKIILESKNEENLAKIIAIISGIPELKVAIFNRAGKLDVESISKILIGWVNGEPINKIASKIQRQNQNLDQAIGECNKYINGNLKNYLPWGMNIYQTLTEDNKSESAKMLPSYIYYGVSDKESAIIASIGIPRFLVNNIKSKVKEKMQNAPITVENFNEIKKIIKETSDFGIGKDSKEKTQIKKIIDSHL